MRVTPRNVIDLMRKARLIAREQFVHLADKKWEAAHFDGLKLKVYVRRPADLDAIRGALAPRLRPSTSIVFLQADVCREDLLVEIEATGESPPLPS